MKIAKTSQQWKVFEREVARDLGGTRTGPRGFNLPDVIDLPLIAPECKYMGKIGYKEEHIKQARANAGEKWWALFLREAKSGKRRVVMDYHQFVQLYKLAREHVER